MKPSRSRRFEEGRIRLSLPRIELRFIGRPPRSIVTVSSELPQLFSDSVAIEKILEWLTDHNFIIKCSIPWGQLIVV